MNILITGATGFIGQRIVQRIVETAKDIRILTINRDAGKAEKLLPYQECRHISVEKMQDEIIAFQPDICLHLATLSTSRNDSEIIAPIIESNITFGVRLLDILKGSDSLRLFVNTGSFAEYRNGVKTGFKDAYLYTATKSAFRHFVDYYADLIGYKYITAVPYSVYGGNDTAKKLMDYMIESINAEKPVKMSPGEQVLDFVHVDDIVEFFISVTDNLDKIKDIPQGETFHLGTGTGTQVRQLASIISKSVGKPLNIEWGGLDYRPLDVMYAVAPTSNNEYIGWKAKISLQQGIDELIKKHRNRQ